MVEGSGEECLELATTYVDSVGLAGYFGDILGLCLVRVLGCCV